MTHAAIQLARLRDGEMRVREPVCVAGKLHLGVFTPDGIARPLRDVLTGKAVDKPRERLALHGGRELRA